MSQKKLKELIKLINWAKKYFADSELSTLADEMEVILEDKKKNHPFVEDEKSDNENNSIDIKPSELDSVDSGLALFTDGACRNNPGPGAWAVLAMTVDKDKLHFAFESSGIDVPTTNNRMELSAAINALRLGQDHLIDGEHDLNLPIYLFSDSKYVIEGVEKWLPGWKSKNWKKADNKAPENVDLWKEFDEKKSNFKNLKFIWVKGHAGHPQNEFADKLCNKALDEAGY